jgi:hypothetical protein
MILLAILIGFCLWSTLEGSRDGVLETSRVGELNRVNLHPLFSVERVLVGMLIWAYVNTFKSVYETSIYTVSLGFMFSWFHNGAYYWTRRKLNPKIYTKGWTDTSLTSKALIELNYQERTLMAILGLGLITTIL